MRGSSDVDERIAKRLHSSVYDRKVRGVHVFMVGSQSEHERLT